MTRIDDLLERAGELIARLTGNYEFPNYADPFVRELFDAADDIRIRQSMPVLRSSAGEAVRQPE